MTHYDNFSNKKTENITHSKKNSFKVNIKVLILFIFISTNKRNSSCHNTTPYVIVNKVSAVIVYYVFVPLSRAYKGVQQDQGGASYDPRVQRRRPHVPPVHEPHPALLPLHIPLNEPTLLQPREASPHLCTYSSRNYLK